MGLQLIVQAESESAIRNLLAEIAGQSEVFNISGELWGICIPRKLIDDLGEEAVRTRLKSLNIFDLYEGRWLYAKRPAR